MANVQDEFVRLYASGRSMHAIAKEYGCSSSYVHRVLKRSGCASRKAGRRIETEKARLAYAMRVRDGLTYRQIAEAMGTYHGWAFALVRRGKEIASQEGAAQ